MGSDLGKVVQLQVYLTSMDLLHEICQVCAELFEEPGPVSRQALPHRRAILVLIKLLQAMTCVEVTALQLGTDVEMDCVAIL